MATNRERGLALIERAKRLREDPLVPKTKRSIFARRMYLEGKALIESSTYQDEKADAHVESLINDPDALLSIIDDAIAFGDELSEGENYLYIETNTDFYD